MVHTNPEFEIFEFDSRHLGSHKHVINIIMGFRDMGRYTTCLWPSWSTLCAPSEPTRSRSSRLTPRVQVPIQLSYFLLSPSHSTIFISHFAAVNSIILLHWTQPFSTVKPAILPEGTQPFCQTVSKFSLSQFVAMNSSIFATMLNHFALVNSVILLSHLVILSTIFATLNSAICLQCSSFFDCYSALSFLLL
jgi:hypothetical protein